MRIVLICDWYFYYAAGLAAGLTQAGADVLLVTRDHGTELGVHGDAVEAKRALLPDGVRMTIVRGRQSDPRSGVSALKVASEVRHFKPDVVNVQDHFDWRLYVVGRVAQALTLVTLHDVQWHPGSEDIRNAQQKWVSRRLRRTADGFIVHGQVLAESLRRQSWWAGRLIVVTSHGPLAQPTAMTSLPARPTALFFGRLEPYKGLDIFVRAIELGAERIPELRGVIAGAGPEAARVRLLVRRPELFDWREGFVADDAMPALFAESSLVVLPYVEASQSGVVPLAFASGRAVVASDVGSLSEAIDEGATGWLVPPEDVQSLADAIVRALSDPDMLGRVGAEGYRMVATGRLSALGVAREHIAAYAGLLATATGGRVDDD